MAKKPMLYEIQYTGAAARDLKKLKGNRPVLESIDRKIVALRANPRSHGVEKLTDDTTYRVRDGEYRILYEIDDKAKTVLITRVRDRKEAYRDR